MKLTLENTDQLVELASASGQRGVECRIWQGRTESGVAVHAYIVRVALGEDEPPEVHQAFAAELKAVSKPRPDLRVIPMRMII